MPQPGHRDTAWVSLLEIAHSQARNRYLERTVGTRGTLCSGVSPLARAPVAPMLRPRGTTRRERSRSPRGVSRAQPPGTFAEGMPQPGHRDTAWVSLLEIAHSQARNRYLERTVGTRGTLCSGVSPLARAPVAPMLRPRGTTRRERS